MKDEELFINHINNHYAELKNKYWKFCKEKQYDWDEDVFSDTILKCHESIRKRGIKDKSAYGLESYFFKSFKNNILNEKRYSRVKKRDKNVNSENINEVYEEYYNENYTSEKTKIINDLFKDFSVLYIMAMVEDNFDTEHFYLFRIKTLCNLTFKQLAEQSKIKASRKKFIEVQRWVKQNISKHQVKEAFNKQFGDLIFD